MDWTSHLFISYLIDNDGAVSPYERGVEVEDDVDEEGQVDDGVDDQKRDVVVVEAPVEGQVERNHDDGVEGQAEDQPVPDNLGKMEVMVSKLSKEEREGGRESNSAPNKCESDRTHSKTRKTLTLTLQKKSLSQVVEGGQNKGQVEKQVLTFEWMEIPFVKKLPNFNILRFKSQNL